MKLNKIIFLSVFTLVSLTACDSKTVTSNVANTTTSSNQETATEADYTPNNAPKDYESINPESIGDEKEDLCKAFFYVNHKMLNSNYYSRVSGTTTSTLLSQDITGFRVYNNGKGFTQAVTKTSEDSTLGIKVSNGEQRVEDISGKNYANRLSNKDENVVISTDSNNVIYGEVTNDDWQNITDLHTRKNFKETIGHDIFGITNYYVPNSKAIKSIEKNTWTTNHRQLDITFNLADSDTTIDARQGYDVEQQHMIEKSVSTAKLDITQLSISLVFDDNWNASELFCNEVYHVTVGVTFDMKSSFTTKFFTFESINSIDVESYKTAYQGAITAFSL